MRCGVTRRRGAHPTLDRLPCILGGRRAADHGGSPDNDAAVGGSGGRCLGGLLEIRRWRANWRRANWWWANWRWLFRRRAGWRRLWRRLRSGWRLWWGSRGLMARRFGRPLRLPLHLLLLRPQPPHLLLHRRTLLSDRLLLRLRRLPQARRLGLSLGRRLCESLLLHLRHVLHEEGRRTRPREGKQTSCKEGDMARLGTGVEGDTGEIRGGLRAEEQGDRESARMEGDTRRLRTCIARVSSAWRFPCSWRNRVSRASADATSNRPHARTSTLVSRAWVSSGRSPLHTSASFFCTMAASASGNLSAASA